MYKLVGNTRRQCRVFLGKLRKGSPSWPLTWVLKDDLGLSKEREEHVERHLGSKVSLNCLKGFFKSLEILIIHRTL